MPRPEDVLKCRTQDTSARSVVERGVDVEDRRLRVRAVERFDAAQVIRADVVQELLTMLLHGQQRRVGHVREQRVEHVADLVDEVVDVVLERAVVGRDDGQLGVLLEKHESGEVHGRKLLAAMEHTDDRYLSEDTRDFIAVFARPKAVAATG